MKMDAERVIALTGSLGNGANQCNTAGIDAFCQSSRAL